MLSRQGRSPALLHDGAHPPPCKPYHSSVHHTVQQQDVSRLCNAQQANLGRGHLSADLSWEIGPQTPLIIISLPPQPFPQPLRCSWGHPTLLLAWGLCLALHECVPPSLPPSLRPPTQHHHTTPTPNTNTNTNTQHNPNRRCALRPWMCWRCSGTCLGCRWTLGLKRLCLRQKTTTVSIGSLLVCV